MSEAIANFTRKCLAGLGLRSFARMSNKAAQRLGIGLICLLSLIIIVPTVAMVNKAEGDKKQGKISYTEKVNPISPNSSIPSEGALLIYANITSINLNHMQYTMNFYVDPVGALLARSAIPRRLNDSVQVYYGSKLVSYNAGEQAISHDVVHSFALGDQNDYPFDKYVHSFSISAAKPSTRVNGTVTFGDPVPIGVLVGGAIQSWSISANVLEDPSLPEVRVEIIVKRAGTTRFFSMFVFMITWALSLAASILAVSIWVRDRQVEPPTMAVMSSLLFALPAIRNTQPGAPPIGCTVDVGGFFWAMAIVSVSALSLLVNYIQKTGKPKHQATKRKQDEEMDSVSSSPNGLHSSLTPLKKMMMSSTILSPSVMGTDKNEMDEISIPKSTPMLAGKNKAGSPHSITRKEVDYHHLPPRQHIQSQPYNMSSLSPPTSAAPSKRTTSLSPLNPLCSPDRSRKDHHHQPLGHAIGMEKSKSADSFQLDLTPVQLNSGLVVSESNARASHTSDPPVLRISTGEPIQLDGMVGSLESGSTESSVSVDMTSPDTAEDRNIRSHPNRNTAFFLYERERSSMSQAKMQDLPISASKSLDPRDQFMMNFEGEDFDNDDDDYVIEDEASKTTLGSSNQKPDILKNLRSAKPWKMGPGSIVIPSRDSKPIAAILNHYPSGIFSSETTAGTTGQPTFLSTSEGTNAKEGMKNSNIAGGVVIPPPPKAALPSHMSVDSARWADTRDSLFLRK